MSPQSDTVVRQSSPESAKDPRQKGCLVARLSGAAGDMAVVLLTRRGGDGLCYGRLSFDAPSGESRETSEILRGKSEDELAEAVGLLRDYHLWDLYQSLG